MALVMLSLMLCRRPGEVKLAPILDAADDAFVVKNLLASNSGNPMRRVSYGSQCCQDREATL